MFFIYYKQIFHNCNKYLYYFKSNKTPHPVSLLVLLCATLYLNMIKITSSQRNPIVDTIIAKRSIIIIQYVQKSIKKKYYHF